MKRIVLTAIGEDRPGIVAAVTEVLYKNKCNIEDSSMTILEGEFAMILIFSAPKESSAQKLSGQFKDVEKHLNLFMQLKEMEIPAPQTKGAPSQNTYMVSLLGSDQPGLVYQVARILADRKINITDVNTKRMGSARSPTYAMLIEVELADPTSLKPVESDLDKLAKELKAEITIKPVDVLQL